MEKKYVPLSKRTKKAQKEYHAQQRRDWGNISPVSRVSKVAKKYDRKAAKNQLAKELRKEV